MQQKMMQQHGRESESPPGGGVNWPAHHRRPNYFNKFNNHHHQNNTNGYEKRGNKTLGWYLNDGLFDKSLSSETSSPSPPALHHQSSGDSGLGGGGPIAKTRATANALAKAIVTPSPPPQQHSYNSNQSGMSNENANPAMQSNDDKRKRKGRQRHRKVLDYSSALMSGGNSIGQHQQVEEVCDEMRNGMRLSGAAPETRKDDYWYYDPASDGYYYEVNGSRGWRKRDPNMIAKDEGQRARQRIEAESRAAHLNGYSSIQRDQQHGGANGYYAASSGAYQHQQLGHHQFANAAAQSKQHMFMQPIQYYDPATDGYYYEMASVDGWKKRQPNSGQSQLSNSGHSQLSNSGHSQLSNSGHSQLSKPQQPVVPANVSGRSRLHQGHYGPVPGASIPSSTSGHNDSGYSDMSSLSSPPPPRLTKPNNLWQHPDDVSQHGESSHHAEEMYHLPSNLFSARYSTDGWRSQPDTPLKTPFPLPPVGNNESIFAFHSPIARQISTDKSMTKQHRPGSLILPPVTALESTEKQARKTSANLLDRNFNADRFLQDIQYTGSADPEKILRDLAALKTPNVSMNGDEKRPLTISCSRQNPAVTPDWSSGMLDSPVNTARDFLDSLLTRDGMAVETAVWPSAIGLYAAPLAGRKLVD